MLTGMLWFDNDPRSTLAAKIERAAVYFKKKYLRAPDLCMVHPGAGDVTPEVETIVGKIAVRAYRGVPPGHLWLGVDEPTLTPVPMTALEEDKNERTK